MNKKLQCAIPNQVRDRLKERCHNASIAGNIKIIFAKQHVMKKLLVILFFITSYSFGQQPLQLNDAINIALKNSYDIEVAKNNVQINSINNNYGVAGGLPAVTG